MLKASELRIGNYVKNNSYSKLEFNEVMGVSKYFVEGSFGTTEIEDISPIPLTPEWLERFGFEKSYHGITSKRIEFTKNKIILQSLWHEEGTPNVRWNINHLNCNGFSYVHQLQNIYFALTNTELTLQNELENNIRV